MDVRWRWNKFKLRVAMILLLLFSCMFQLLQTYSTSDNIEGLALLKFKERIVNDPFGALSSWKLGENGDELNHCSWYGVDCAGGRVVALDLRDSCLQGTLAPELAQLPQIKLINLRNNSFSGVIPQAIRELKGLQVLDLGYNNCCCAFAHCRLPISITNTGQSGNIARRRLFQLATPSNAIKSNRQTPSSSPSLSPHPLSPARQPFRSKSITPSASGSDFPSLSPSELSAPSPSPALPPLVTFKTRPQLPSPAPSHPSDPNQTLGNTKKSNKHLILIVVGVTVVSVILLASGLGFLYSRSSKVVSIKPWSTVLSGHLQRAFVAGVPKLQRSELVSACEDFSNIIGSLSDGNTIYKGTLSSGVEIAVASTAVKSAEDWSKNLESQFREKIDLLSKVNHRNFVNLIGYCEEEDPFTRMMVFEYAPNGTLYEHLHVKESEHLDWKTRLRIAMGMAYCLEYMHELNQPIALKNLQSSSVYLTEDYAAKIADFGFRNEETAAKMDSATMELLEIPKADPETSVYNFGVLLFEMITGRLIKSMGDVSLADWASVYMTKEQPLTDVIDPTLTSFRDEEVKKLLQVVKDCVQPDPKHRPKMREVTVRLKEITALGPENAIPNASALWWAELEIMSTGSGSN